MDKFLTMFVALHNRILDVADRKDRGATATEYALLVALIALVITVGVLAFGNALNKFFDDLATKVGTLFK